MRWDTAAKRKASMPATLDTTHPAARHAKFAASLLHLLKECRGYLSGGYFAFPISDLHDECVSWPYQRPRDAHDRYKESETENEVHTRLPRRAITSA